MSTPTTPTIIHHGSHETYADGHCLLEVVAHLACEPHSDRPACCCPVFAAFARGLNDAISDDATRTRLLAPLAPLLVGTRSDDAATEQARAYQLADLAVRRWAPRALDDAGLGDAAATLRALAPITGKDTAARARAYAAYAAARGGAREAATYAAHADADAAYAAARAAAHAAHAATYAAHGERDARDGAYAAARAAAAARAYREDAAACLASILRGEPLPA